MIEHSRVVAPVLPAQAKVMVIEDNLDNMDLALTLLREDVGVYYANTRPSGHAFFQWLHSSTTVQQNPKLLWLDLILLDLQLPRESGYGILESLRALPTLRQTRVIAFTANVLQADIDRCRAAGFDGFIGKPIQVRRFPDQICRVLAGEAVWEPC